MWVSDWKCTREANHHYETVTKNERDPRIWPEMAPKCAMCGKYMTLAKVENLSQIDYSRPKKSKRKGGFKVEQRPLL